MENQSEAERLLSENLAKCRCCFRILIDDRGAVRISDEIRIQFKDLTQIELLEAEMFADKICQLCASDLTVFANLRQDLVSKQKNLYELAGIDEAFITQQCEEAEFTHDTSSDMGIEFEAVEQDEEETVFIDEQVFSEEQQEDLEAMGTIIKIEKVCVKTNDSKMEIDDGSTSFDLFEEIIDSVESDDQQSQGYNSENIKQEQEIISCDTCGIEVQKNHLVQHVQIMHKTFICEQCDKKFPSKISLSRHTIEDHSSDRIMRSKKRHFCPLCPKDYDYRKQLDDHIRSFHDKERNSECQICNKVFYHRDLKKHIAHVHGDKNVSCPTCGKLYTCVENLRLHMRYHLPPSYTCSSPGCDRKFHQKVLWEHHEKKHTDVKPFGCEQCSAMFYSIRDLKRHCQRVHDKVTRKCFLCEAQFSRKDKYRLHLMKKHPELSNTERESLLDQIRSMKWNES